MSLIEPSKTYRPHRYPWAFEFWERQQQLHWLGQDIPMGQDVQDWKNVLTDQQRNMIGGVFRMFVQADVDVHNCYHKLFMAVFKPTEIQMMLTAFSNMETVHIAAYSHLLDTLGLPETEYAAFLEYDQMRAKHDFMHSFDINDPTGVAKSLAGVSAFGEGLSLFASFAMLLNYPRQNLLKGMGQIVSYSVRDESLHCEGIMRLYHQWLAENPGIDRKALARDIGDICDATVRNEDAFIDLVHAGGEVPGATSSEYKAYIRYIANLRLRGLGLGDAYETTRNPLPWIDGMQAGIEHANFFEQQPTEYSRAASAGDWGEAF